MADFIFNIAKGRQIELYNRVKSNDPANSAFVVALLKVAEADATLITRDTLAAILAAANTEADFTNYTRKVLTDADLAAFPAPDDGNNRYDVDLADQVWPNAGGVSDNTMVKFLLCYDPDTTGGDDSTIVPLACFDYGVTTNGTDLSAVVNAAGIMRDA